MKNNFKKSLKATVAVATVAMLQACGTYQGPHGGPSTGARVDLDVLGVGVDASVGVHAAGGGGLGQRILVGAPCARTEAVMQSAESLMAWASNGGQGEVIRRAQVNGNDNPRGAGYNCSANMTGVSRQVNGQESPPIRQQQGQQFQQFPQQQMLPQQQQFPQQQQGRVYYGR